MTVSNVPVQTGSVLVMGVAAAKAGAEAVRGLPVTGAQAVIEAGNYAREVAMVAGGLSTAALALIRRGRHLDLVAGQELDEEESG